MDITKFSTKKTSDEGAWMAIVDPVSGDPTDARIKLVGQDSPRFRRIQREAMAKRMNRGGKQKVTPEEIEARELSILVELTLEWEGLEANGEELPFTEENVRKIYSDYPWLRDQVDQFFSDRQNYLGNS